jgi:hypothetical protein
MEGILRFVVAVLALILADPEFLKASENSLRKSDSPAADGVYRTAPALIQDWWDDDKSRGDCAGFYRMAIMMD